MKSAFFFTTFMFVSLFSFCQDSMAYKLKTLENGFIYSKNTIKLYINQRYSIKTKEIDGKIEIEKLLDSTQSHITDLNYVSLLPKQNAGKNICIDFNVLDDENSRSKYKTVLIVNNPYKEALSYKAKIFSNKAGGYIETSVLDIRPGISAIETWPYKIYDIILYDLSIKNN
ncbi:MAG: hypothetical protein QM737_18260 [Ferruginibacter sp.]